MLQLLRREDFTYTSCYCEENVYLALRTLEQHWEGWGCAVFISNQDKRVCCTSPLRVDLKCTEATTQECS
jgi:hypothetical protein